MIAQALQIPIGVVADRVERFCLTNAFPKGRLQRLRRLANIACPGTAQHVELARLLGKELARKADFIVDRLNPVLKCIARAMHRSGYIYESLCLTMAGAQREKPDQADQQQRHCPARDQLTDTGRGGQVG